MKSMWERRMRERHQERKPRDVRSVFTSITFELDDIGSVLNLPRFTYYEDTMDENLEIDEYYRFRMLGEINVRLTHRHDGDTEASVSAALGMPRHRGESREEWRERMTECVCAELTKRRQRP